MFRSNQPKDGQSLPTQSTLISGIQQKVQTNSTSAAIKLQSGAFTRPVQQVWPKPAPTNASFTKEGNVQNLKKPVQQLQKTTALTIDEIRRFDEQTRQAAQEKNLKARLEAASLTPQAQQQSQPQYAQSFNLFAQPQYNSGFRPFQQPIFFQDPNMIGMQYNISAQQSIGGDTFYGMANLYKPLFQSPLLMQQSAEQVLMQTQPQKMQIIGVSQLGKVVIPPRGPGAQPTLVFHKQANRILILRQKKAKRMSHLLQQGKSISKGLKPKLSSRVKVANDRERLPDGRFKPKI